MTAHINLRSTEIDRPLTGSAEDSTAGHQRPGRRNVATAGAVLVVLAAGFGLTQLRNEASDGPTVEVDGDSSPSVDLAGGAAPVAGRPDGFWTRAATPAADQYAADPRMPSPGRPDGTWQVPERSTAEPTGRLRVPGQPDGFWTATPSAAAAADTYTGSPKVERSGLPDGTWEPVEVSTGPIHCPVRGYC